MKEGEIKQMGCPNCFKHLAGVVSEDKTMRLRCDRCGLRLCLKQIGPKTYIIKMTLQ